RDRVRAKPLPPSRHQTQRQMGTRPRRNSSPRSLDLLTWERRHPAGSRAAPVIYQAVLMRARLSNSGQIVQEALKQTILRRSWSAAVLCRFLLLLPLAIHLHAEVFQSDICVFGATCGGIAAAIQAARMGKSVQLVEPGKFLGGLTTAGLG